MHLLDASITPDSNLLFCIFLPALYKVIWTYIDILGNFLHFFERIHKAIASISKCQSSDPLHSVKSAPQPMTLPGGTAYPARLLLYTAR